MNAIYSLILILNEKIEQLFELVYFYHLGRSETDWWVISYKSNDVFVYIGQLIHIETDILSVGLFLLSLSVYNFSEQVIPSKKYFFAASSELNIIDALLVLVEINCPLLSQIE